MNIRTKTVFVTIITLVLGVTLGALINPLSKDSKHHKKTTRDFFGYLERIIEPQESQKAALESLFQDYESRFARNDNDYRRNSRATRDSMFADLTLILTEEQNRRLEQKREEWRKKRERSKRNGSANREKNQNRYE